MAEAHIDFAVLSECRHRPGHPRCGNSNDTRRARPMIIWPKPCRRIQTTSPGFATVPMQEPKAGADEF